MDQPTEFRAVREWLMAIPNLAKLLWRLARDPRVPRRNKALFAGVGAYLLIPFDIIPDWIPGIGQLDDAILFLLTLDGLLNRVPEEVLAEHWEGDQEVLKTIRGTLATVTSLVPDRIKRRVFVDTAI
jgi:uncharacterized membrane protein YkvA (DUF1232 family)